MTKLTRRGEIMERMAQNYTKICKILLNLKKEQLVVCRYYRLPEVNFPLPDLCVCFFKVFIKMILTNELPNVILGSELELKMAFFKIPNLALL